MAIEKVDGKPEIWWIVFLAVLPVIAIYTSRLNVIDLMNFLIN
jgi:hypothetical protein